MIAVYVKTLIAADINCSVGFPQNSSCHKMKTIGCI